MIVMYVFTKETTGIVKGIFATEDIYKMRTISLNISLLNLLFYKYITDIQETNILKSLKQNVLVHNSLIFNINYGLLSFYQ